jgi:hypothetical protein
LCFSLVSPTVTKKVVRVFVLRFSLLLQKYQVRNLNKVVMNRGGIKLRERFNF